MKRILSLLAPLALIPSLVPAEAQAQSSRPDTIWFRYDDRVTPNIVIPIKDYTDITFNYRSATAKAEGKSDKGITYKIDAGKYMFSDPGRILYRPNSMMSGSMWNLTRSKESEHFVCFWEDGAKFDVDYILNVGEKVWKVYTDKLGFIIPGQSSTDKYKIIMRVYNSSDWIASGSGEDMKVGTLNLSPGAVTARGGHTVAHEVGHTFQYLTNVDCGANNTHGFNYGLGDDGWGGNGFWEDCANWMGYKVYPERQFTDGEYFEQYIDACHQNIMHEQNRYKNCFYQDFLCDKFGQNFIGRLWRESIRPEDPVDAIMRLQSLDQDGFSALMYDVFSHMCTWDTPSIREAAKRRIGAHAFHLQAVDVEGQQWFQVEPNYCPQNYGYNITELKCPAGKTVKVDFKGIVGADGYRQINVDRAGWRWGLVALRADGTTDYGQMQSTKDGSAEYDVPVDAQRLWLVVMGAPTKWWHHAWDDNTTNDEQWPYRVKLEGTSPKGYFKTYTSADFPEGYVRHDTTVVINAELAYSSSAYSSVRVQYDMDAISEALGITTEQLKGCKRSTSTAAGLVRFASVNANNTTMNFTNTTSTSSATCYGNWFTTAGNVCGYDGSAAIFAECYPDKFGCYVGQYPGRLKAGNTYVIRQAVVYNETTTKRYRATMEVHLTVF